MSECKYLQEVEEKMDELETEGEIGGFLGNYMFYRYMDVISFPRLLHWGPANGYDGRMMPDLI